MSRSDTGPNQDGSTDPGRIDSDHSGREQLRTYAALTGFQRDLLWTLFHEADHEAYGLRVKRQLETLYGEDVNHGRLYPNLDDLVQADLIAKSERDRRTNNYALTDAAVALLTERQAWEGGEQ
ncbi:PadR family transcriptional regulator [Halorubrum sp. HHNYT27]|uniref:PadR family transcriptional regulator n=1 Tax=Halorubrum sp. HHNYT27 TaxID=3402275 RepID=UPI003EBC5819